MVARISTHVLRLEREYHLSKSFTQSSDPEYNHTVRLIDLIRLPSHQNDSNSAMMVSIFESPGRNYLRDVLDFGPTWSTPLGVNCTVPSPAENLSEQLQEVESDGENLSGHISLAKFLEFAIRASECLELLHHGLRVVHGEIRGDAFYFNQETRGVKIVNFGAGPRSFANGLTSTGWSTLSREVGVKSKLQFIAPEQTGRMAAEPDSRTDIYSLGILFWTMLTKHSAFDGETPMDVIQAVLGRRIPAVSFYRIDIPDVVSGIIQKMTQKQIDERYHSTSGLKHDLSEIQKILGDGDREALENFKIGSKDVPSFFVLPTRVFGRKDEQEKIVKVIEQVAKRQVNVDFSAVHGLQNNSTSSISDGWFDGVESGTKSSDTSSQAGKDPRGSPALTATPSSNMGLRHLQLDPQDRLNNIVPPNGQLPSTNDSRDSLEVRITSDHQSTEHKSGSYSGQTMGVPNPRGSHKYRRRGRCEVVTIIGAAGLGKSRYAVASSLECNKKIMLIESPA